MSPRILAHKPPSRRVHVPRLHVDQASVVVARMAEVANELMGAGAVGIDTASNVPVDIVVSAGSNRSGRAYFR